MKDNKRFRLHLNHL